MRAGIAPLAATLLAAAAPAQIDFVARGMAVQAGQRDAEPAVYNYRNDFLARFRAACAQVRTGEARCKVAIVGDSTAAGWGAGSATLSAGARARSFPAYLAKALNARALPAQAEGVFGTAAMTTAANYTAYDPRVTFAGGAGSWLPGAPNVPGGYMFVAGSGVTQVLSFTPAIGVDRFELTYPTNTGMGGASLQIDGGAATVVSENAAPGLARVTVTAASPGTHTLTITPNGSANFYVQAIDAWSGASPAVSIGNMGWPGSAIGDWVRSAQPWETGYAAPAYGAALTVIDLGINDWTGQSGATLAAFTASYQALIAALKAGGSDLVLLVPFPSATSGSPSASAATQAAFAQALYTLARANDCVLIDMGKRFGAQARQAAMNPAQYADALHPKATLYADAAQLIAAVLLR